MENLNPYLTFPGNCEEAFNFYRSIFGGEFLSMGRFCDMPSEDEEIVPEDKMNKIMYISLPTGSGVVLMGRDSTDDWDQEVVVGNNVSLAVTAKTKEEADRYFEGLSRGGHIVMQIGDVFWGSYHGICTDRYGVKWAVTYSGTNSRRAVV